MKANEAPMQFRDKIDEYLWKEHHILGGCCSSIEELKYSVAREVAEKLTDTFIEKTERYIRNIADGLDRDDDVEAFISGFRKYMEGEEV